jgi:hypothetical protein
MSGFFEQNIRFSLFYQNLIKIIFFQNSKNKFESTINGHKRAPGGHESLWTIDKKEKKKNFHFSTVKSQIAKSGIFFSHLKFVGLESWPPSVRKVPILVNTEAD